MKEINNLDITITKGALFSEKKLERTYTIVHGQKIFKRESSTYHTGDSSPPKSLQGYHIKLDST